MASNNIAQDRTSNAITEAREFATIDSDTEYDEQVLQITFDPNLQANRRRRASLVHCEGGNPLYAQALPNSCFVHTLLETQKDRKYTRRNSLVKEIPRKDFPLIRDGVEGTHKSLPLMTKSELADMVLGVRELSKHLSSVQIKMEVRTVLILTKTHDKTLIGCTRKLAEWLLSPERDYPYTVYVERCFAEKPEFDLKGLLDQHPSYNPRLKYWTAELCTRRPHTFDFITTLGGDGTVLFASWLFQKVVPPVFSFSLGSLGFLTKFDFHTFEDSLQQAFNEGVTVGLRLRFEGTIMRSIKNAKSINIDGESIDRDITNEILSTRHKEITHRPDETYIVLNEIVVDRGPNPTMSSTELYGDDMHLSNIEADGLCIATPTGSTAYNLAAGGSLCHPEIPAMLVSPICAHSLSFRPLILPDSMVLRVAVPYNARTTAWVSFDGRQRIELQQGDFVMITASRFPFPAVQCKRDNKDWFDSIRRTMNWGSRIRQQGGGHE